MRHITNVEIKARIKNPARIRKILLGYADRIKGTDFQTDTYFKVREGRLKLREGKLESRLIFYKREDSRGPKRSDLSFLPLKETKELKKKLEKDLEKISVVKKRREIYYAKNVRFHIDQVRGLGNFVEIEAQDEHGARTEKELLKQCLEFIEILGINGADLVAGSYGDLIKEKMLLPKRPAKGPGILDIFVISRILPRQRR